ncbi:nucleoside triphosphate pyrophosphohydrolase [Alcanivorax sp. MM125-6]|nr:nucleoside triphosphate pyrophosphohydrolase [Alcanivorax sp. MM125-6]
MSDNQSSSSEAAIAELLAIMARLRDPDGGCPWDLKQTFDTVVPYTVEEAFEVAEAVARRDYPELREELGDLLLQVVFHSQMAREQGLFDFAEVVAVLNEKMVRRHPHVFGDEGAADAEAVKVNWEVIKAGERARKGREHDSALDGVPEGLPALQRAHKLQKKASKVGFDWRQPAPVRDQVGLELTELDRALEEGDRDAIEDELGDVFFTLVNLARHLKLDPDLALRRASDKFERRFRRVERLADAPLSDYDEAGLDALWRQAKKTP